MTNAERRAANPGDADETHGIMSWADLNSFESKEFEPELGFVQACGCQF